MTDSEIIKSRLVNQSLLDSAAGSPEDIISRMGAIQAQDFAMSRWALGIRIPGINETDVIKAIDEGKILRTHLLRPTWHLVSSEDIHWMLELTAPNILRSMKSRHRELELSDKILNRIMTLFEKEFRDKDILTRKELLQILNKNKIAVNDNRAAHIFMYAELSGLLCSGTYSEKQNTYSALPNRIKRKRKLSKEEALAELAHRYFNTRSPAAVQDFIWWSGLSAADAKEAVNLIRKSLNEIKLDSMIYYTTGEQAKVKLRAATLLLPAYDEFILSYKNRSVLILSDNHKKIISMNGLFRPVVLINGIVKGTWKRIVKGGKVNIEFAFFDSKSTGIKHQVGAAAARYAGFINKKLEIKFITDKQ